MAERVKRLVDRGIVVAFRVGVVAVVTFAVVGTGSVELLLR